MLPAALRPRVRGVDRGEAMRRARTQAGKGRSGPRRVYRKLRKKGRLRLLAWQAQRRASTGRPAPAARFLSAAGDSERLVPSPVFVLSATRSGSTLLRMVLDSHSQICAPHEMHLRQVKVNISHPNAKIGMAECGLTSRDLENLLW